ncbi:glycoside hydrolase family 55 protein [Natronosalvus halobius]|uniref:glycoside hydrolase family 55 protein n=1 Tax=Natronosalvus halobius TaxID=2953746 RepID=UPI00209F5C4E|nr:glycoside hydrolase family 55 protein [Natronosalvus halobius]USZ72083.1 glycoside hydrolase family 55 protein [Natronosalvus halobius]
MNRRKYLTAVGGLPPTLAGYVLSVQGAEIDEDGNVPAPDADRATFADHWRHVDVVDYGADPTGEDDVTPVLEEIIAEEGGDELLVLFPPGTYRMDAGFEHDSFRDFGLLGYNATIEPSSTFEGVGVYDSKVFALGPSRSFSGHNVYIGGFEFDFGNVEDEDGIAGSAVVSYATGDVIFEHLVTAGRPTSGRRMIELMGMEDSRGQIYDCVVDGGPGVGVYVETTDNAVATITHSLVRNCADNGFYCSNGSVVIENCTAIDNDISNVRIGGVVRDSVVWVRDSELSNARGYWLRDGDCWVENCYGYNDAEGSRPVLEVAPSGASVTITGSRFGSDADRRIAVVNEDGEGDDGLVTFRDCTFFGEKNSNVTEDAITVARDETAFLDCSCSLTGDVYPIRFNGGPQNCRVIGGRYDSERPIRFESGRGGVVRDVTLETGDSVGRLEIDVPDVVVENVPGDVSTGVRTVIDGLGANGSSNPADDGDWHDHGREGVLVAWTDPDADEERLSIYRNGDWYSWTVE